MTHLFSTGKFRSVEVANRIVVSPMCQYVADNGKATSWHQIHLGGLALSGAGTVFIESTAVEPEGRITPGDLGLWDEETEAAFEPVIDAVRQYSKVALIMQLGHAGRKASSRVPWELGQQIPESEGGWLAYAPSAIALKEGEVAPIELNRMGLARVKAAFVAAAKRAARLGVDGIELHGAHGYLLHQFCSPISNQRTDEYGGSLENRIRFPLEVFKAVREVFPADKPVGMKITGSDWIEGGWDIGQAIVLAKELKNLGADWVDVSSGGISPLQKIAPSPGYQVTFSEAIREATGLQTISVGLITEARQADDIIKNGQADFVALARAMLYDPRWGWHAAAELGAKVDAPPSYWRATPNHLSDLFQDAIFGGR